MYIKVVLGDVFPSPFDVSNYIIYTQMLICSQITILKESLQVSP